MPPVFTGTPAKPLPGTDAALSKFAVCAATASSYVPPLAGGLTRRYTPRTRALSNFHLTHTIRSSKNFAF
jgi:hypothetical protein